MEEIEIERRVNEYLKREKSLITEVEEPKEEEIREYWSSWSNLKRIKNNIERFYDFTAGDHEFFSLNRP